MVDIKKQKQNQIYWHKKDIKIEFESWSSEETETPISMNNIYAPGPRTEPPFEVEIITSRFLYENGKESSLYVIKIGSLMHSWVLIKSIKEILDLIHIIRENTTVLDRLNIKRFKSICVESYRERDSMIQLILNTLLNDSAYYKYIQQFILTNTLAESHSLDIRKIEEILEREGKDGVFLVEYKGWVLGWKVHHLQMLNNVIVNSSIRSGKVKDIINTQDIKIINKIVIIKGENINKELIAHDNKTIEIIKKWIHSIVY